MPSNKRKTVQIKRPEETGDNKPNKPLPKVNVSESAASATETDEQQPVSRKTEQVSKVDPTQSVKGATMKVPLPDEDKLKKARKADVVEDEKLPSADEVMAAAKNATAQITIDTEDVQTPEQELSADDSDEQNADRTMQIDPASLEEDEDKNGSDMTMKIDADALQTGDVGKALAEADAEEDSDADRTMQIDVNALDDAEKEQESREQLQSQETMMMEAIPEEDVQKARPGKSNEKFNAATIAIPGEDQEGAEEQEPVTKEKMEESFNAMTMAMDPNELNAELEQPQAEDNPDQTMDLTEQRPKTILIKRPSKEAPSGSPTVKTVRPDAQTVRTARPVSKSRLTDEQKASTSRIDVPTTEGKTVKLRRPGGARPGAPISSVASRAGLQMNEDGTVQQTAPAKVPSLGAGWLVVSIFTFLITAAALYAVLAVDMTDLPMIGRLVDINDTVIMPGQ